MVCSAFSSFLSFGLIAFTFSTGAVASESSRSGTAQPPVQFAAPLAMPAPEAVELEQPGVHYQLAIVQGAVQVMCSGEKGQISVRVLAESDSSPEMLDHSARWVQPEGGEWRMTRANGTLALTAVAGQGGGSPSDIVLRFEGAKSLSLDALGNLLIVTDAGDLHQQRPAVVNANAAPVPSSYVLLGGNRVAVEIHSQHANVGNSVDAIWSSGLEFGNGH